MEGDVDYGFEFDGGVFAGGGAEFPLAEGADRIGVELGIEAADKLDTVDRAIAADYAVEDDFAFDVVGGEGWRVFGVDLFGGNRSSEIAGGEMGGGAIGAHFGEIKDPAAGGAVEIGHVDVQRVDFFGEEDRFGLGAGSESGEIGRAGADLGFVGLGLRGVVREHIVRRGEAEF